MVVGDRIAKVDVWKNKSITTLSGAKIGDTEAKIKSLYPGQIQVTPHKYVPAGSLPDICTETRRQELSCNI
jgi:hypothetical protein